MNRKRWLILLAVLLPLVIFGAAKWAARWRPVAMGSVNSVSYFGENASISASKEVVVVLAHETTIFDLASGQRTTDETQSVCKDGLATWQLRRGAKTQLLIHRNGGTRVYDLPTGELSKDLFVWLASVQVFDAPDRVELCYEKRYIRWQPNSPTPQRAFRLPELGSSIHADNAYYTEHDNFEPVATRDGRALVDASGAGNHGTIARLSTDDGRVTGRVKAENSSDLDANFVSTFGSYAIFTSGTFEAPKSLRWDAVDTVTGRLLWSVPRQDKSWLVFSPDEKWCAVASPQQKEWQIRETKTGIIQRTLTLMPGTIAGAFSPDGATLYSVAGGVLYGQRAR